MHRLSDIATVSETVGLTADVERFLRANPSWLAERPDLYRALTPPARFCGDAMADHLVAMVRAERRHAAEQTARADGVLAAGRAAAGLAYRVQQAVLALIRASDPVDCIHGELAPLLGLDAAHLCMEGQWLHARPLPEGYVAAALDGRAVAVRSDPPDAALVHGEAARLATRDALVRVDWQGAPSLISLVSRDAAALDQAQAGALAFLGLAAGATLDRGQ